MERAREIARAAVESLGITSSIRSILVAETDSPWNEKALIKRKGGHLDIKITVWKDEAFLYGRVFRLFLYIRDVLDPGFQYDPSLAPDEHRDPMAAARYNQIWSLYVDSRMEKKGLENFFDRTTRRNLFIDMEKQTSWKEADALFHELWLRPSFTYPEIVDLSHRLGQDRAAPTSSGITTPEVSVNTSIASPHVMQHLERIPSAELRNAVNEVLSFTAYHCKDCFITSSYFGMLFLYQRRVFVELIPASDGTLYFTHINPASDEYETETLAGNMDIGAVQGRIKKIYDTIAAQSRDM